MDVLRLEDTKVNWGHWVAVVKPTVAKLGYIGHFVRPAVGMLAKNPAK